MTLTGLDRLLLDPGLLRNGGRLGLLYNQASVDARYRPAPEALAGAFPGRITALFGPQHGTGCTEQDNMIESPHSRHPALHVPLYSLYSGSVRPSAAMLDAVDTVLVDLVDVGTRVYTFATTVVYLMQRCAEPGKVVVILDRPNPINGVDVEGNALNPAFASFVGPYPLPMRHGMTLGELMMYYNEVFSLGCELHVIPAAGWDRAAYHDATGLPWVMPSPNMPTVDTAVVYPGQVLLEGTNLSEGRGTTRPFELFGAPFLDTGAFLRELDHDSITGAILRPAEFRPTFNKWAGQVCRGFQIHVLDRRVFKPYRCGLAILAAALRSAPDDFQWTDPPYEYVFDRAPIDVILGDGAIRRTLESGARIADIVESWQPELARFNQERRRMLLYPVETA